MASQAEMPEVGRENPREVYVTDPKSATGQTPLIVRQQRCVATGPYQRYHRMSDWCQQNCLAYPPYCPPDICICLSHCSPRPGRNITELECNKACMRFPNDNCPKDCECFPEKAEDEADNFSIIVSATRTGGGLQQKQHYFPWRQELVP